LGEATDAPLQQIENAEHKAADGDAHHRPDSTRHDIDDGAVAAFLGRGADVPGPWAGQLPSKRGRCHRGEQHNQRDGHAGA
jgi:hypothetical protein